MFRGWCHGRWFFRVHTIRVMSGLGHGPVLWVEPNVHWPGGVCRISFSARHKITAVVRWQQLLLLILRCVLRSPLWHSILWVSMSYMNCICQSRGLGRLQSSISLQLSPSGPLEDEGLGTAPDVAGPSAQTEMKWTEVEGKRGTLRLKKWTISPSKWTEEHSRLAPSLPVPINELWHEIVYSALQFPAT